VDLVRRVLQVEPRQARRVDRLREKSARERVALAGLIESLDADGEECDQNCGGLDETHCLDARRRRAAMGRFLLLC
jgi:hypothetical protein